MSAVQWSRRRCTTTGSNRAQSRLLNIRPAYAMLRPRASFASYRSPSLLRTDALVSGKGFTLRAAPLPPLPACSSTPRSTEISTVDMPTAHLSRPTENSHSPVPNTFSIHARRIRLQQSGRRTTCPSGVCFTQHIEAPLTMPTLKEGLPLTHPHLPSDRIRHSPTCRRRRK